MWDRRYNGIGWRFYAFNKTNVAWSAPGGWNDCDPQSMINVTVPGTGWNIKTVVSLSPSMVQTWLANSNSNYGVLMRAVTGSVSLTYNDSVATRMPTLRVHWTTIPGMTLCLNIAFVD